MRIKTYLGVIAVITMLPAFIGCEYYDDKTGGGTLDGSKAVTTQGAADDKVAEIAKQIDDLKKQMAASDSDEIKALEAKIAELEKKLVEAQSGGAGVPPGPSSACPKDYACDVVPGEGTCQKLAAMCGPNSEYKTQGTCGTESCPGSCFSCVLATGANDHTAPVVAERSPMGDVVAPSTKTITVTFSEAIKVGTITEDSLSIEPAVAIGDVTTSSNNKLFTFALEGPLGVGKTYKVTLDKEGIKDEAGNLMAEDLSWTFTTARRGIITNTAIIANIANAVAVKEATHASLTPGAWRAATAGNPVGDACVATCDTTGLTTNGVITDLMAEGGGLPLGGADLQSVRFGCAKMSEDPKKGGTALENQDPVNTNECGSKSYGFSNDDVEGAPYVAIGLSGAEEKDGFRCLKLIQAPLLMANAMAGGNPVDQENKKYSKCIPGSSSQSGTSFPDLTCQAGEVLTGVKFAMGNPGSMVFNTSKSIIGISEIQCKKVELK